MLFKIKLAAGLNNLVSLPVITFPLASSMAIALFLAFFSLNLASFITFNIESSIFNSFTNNLILLGISFYFLSFQYCLL